VAVPEAGGWAGFDGVDVPPVAAPLDPLPLSGTLGSDGTDAVAVVMAPESDPGVSGSAPNA
jgi:hypothetical protein